MKRTEDRALWHEAWLDTPITGPYKRLDPDEAFKTPGSHVKSKKRAANGWPADFGVLVSFSRDPDAVTVRSVGSPVSPAGTVWSGTRAEYYAMWEID